MEKTIKQKQINRAELSLNFYTKNKKSVFVRSEKLFKIMIKSKNFRESFNIYHLNSDSEKELLTRISKNKSKNGILISNDSSVSYVYKKRQSWVFSDHSSLDLFFANHLEIINLVSNFENNTNEIVNKILPILNNNSRIDFNVINNLDILFEQLMFFNNENWKNILDEFEKKYSFLKLTKKVVDKKYANLVIEILKSGKGIAGIANNKILKEDEGLIIFKSKSAKIIIEIVDDDCIFSFVSWSSTSIDSHYYKNGLVNNLKNNILNIKTSNRKLNKKEIILGLFGLITFIILLIVTFSIILRPENTSAAIKILFSKETFKHPWIYLLWTNFLISYFFGFIITLIITVIITGKKPNWKTAWNVFVARQLKLTTRFITGEAIIGTIIMAWYMARENNIRVSGYVGTMATMSLIRIPLELIIGFPIMLTGQLYGIEMLHYFNDSGLELNIGVTSSVFFSLAWFGYAWSMIHNSLVSFIIILPPAQYIYNFITTKYFVYNNKNNIITYFNNREKSIESLKLSTKKVFRNRQLLMRVTFTLVFLTIIEALETMYIFNIVEESMSARTNFDDYFYSNFLQLTGIRLMINRLHECPIINIIPGSGLGIIEYLMSNINEVIFIYHHDFNNINEMKNLASSFSQETAFITRFFNIYLQRFLSLSITLWVCFKLLKKIKLSKS